MSLEELKEKVEAVTEQHRSHQILTDDDIDTLLDYIEILEYQVFRLERAFKKREGKEGG